MTYYLMEFYTLSDLGALEKKALPWLEPLENRIIDEAQIPALERALNGLREKLEMENPRCRGVEVSVEKDPYMDRLAVRFGRITSTGILCRPLNLEELKFWRAHDRI